MVGMQLLPCGAGHPVQFAQLIEHSPANSREGVGFKLCAPGRVEPLNGFVEPQHARVEQILFAQHAMVGQVQALHGVADKPEVVQEQAAARLVGALTPILLPRLLQRFG
jgi:hypothetical protein